MSNKVAKYSGSQCVDLLQIPFKPVFLTPPIYVPPSRRLCGFSAAAADSPGNYVMFAPVLFPDHPTSNTTLSHASCTPSSHGLASLNRLQIKSERSPCSPASTPALPAHPARAPQARPGTAHSGRFIREEGIPGAPDGGEPFTYCMLKSL